jgi:hypothetical protein
MAGAAWIVHPATETRVGDKRAGTLGASAFASLSGTLAGPGGDWSGLERRKERVRE